MRAGQQPQTGRGKSDGFRKHRHRDKAPAGFYDDSDAADCVRLKRTYAHILLRYLCDERFRRFLQSPNPIQIRRDIPYNNVHVFVNRQYLTRRTR